VLNAICGLSKHLEASGDLQPICTVKDPYGDGFGIAVCLGPNVSEDWQSGKIVVFWRNGDVTACDYLEDVIIEDLWEHLS
jgi:hypothetical protein